MALPILNKIKQWDAFRIIRDLFAAPLTWLNNGEAVSGSPSAGDPIVSDGSGGLEWGTATDAQVFNRIDAAGDIRIDGNGDLRITN